jgi:hypothetical protein
VGALIRTAGLGFIETPAEEPRWHVVEAGDHVAMDEGRAQYLPGYSGFVGPKDKMPAPNPGFGGSATGGTASGNNGITPLGDLFKPGTSFSPNGGGGHTDNGLGNGGIDNGGGNGRFSGAP